MRKNGAGLKYFNVISTLPLLNLAIEKYTTLPSTDKKLLLSFVARNNIQSIKQYCYKDLQNAVNDIRVQHHVFCFCDYNFIKMLSTSAKKELYIVALACDYTDTNKNVFIWRPYELKLELKFYILQKILIHTY